GMIPVYHFLVSAAILVFMVIFWRTHHRGHRNWLALLLFVLCSVNSWPLRMVKGKRAARTVLTGMCYSVGSATRQGSSSPTRFIGQSAMT
ncbi:hypothetical protein NI821_27585, partial [Escherichia coli]|nr:hypothetical protein [Escherichia coli]MCO7842361.1 hypothetical protein [Escherichia coli]